MRCWTRFCCPSAKATGFWGRFPSGKIDELIAHTYQGDHEKMKLAVNNVGLCCRACKKR